MHELPAKVVGWCPWCRYDLRATLTLSGTTCSECGAQLPFDRLTYPARPTKVELLRATAVIAVTLAIVAIATLLVVAVVSGAPLVRWPSAVVGTAAAVAIVLRLAWPQSAPARRWLAVAIITMLALLASPVEWLAVTGALIIVVLAVEWLSGAPRPAAVALNTIGLPLLNLAASGRRAIVCLLRSIRCVARIAPEPE